MNKIKNSSNISNRRENNEKYNRKPPKSIFERFKDGVNRGILYLTVGAVLVSGFSFNPVQAQSLNTQGQTSIQKILEQRKKQQSQLSSEETQVQETSQQNNLIKQPDVDPNNKYNPPQEFIYIKGLPGTLWSKVDLQPKDNEKFGIPRLSPGMTPDMIVKKFQNWEEIYSRFRGVSDLMEVKVRYYRGSFVGADIIMKTDKGEFTFFSNDLFYPVAVSVNKDKISITGIDMVPYFGVDGKRHYAANYALQLVAERGKPPKYIVHHLVSGISIQAEYRDEIHTFEGPLLKKWESSVKKLLKRAEDIPPGEIRVNAKYVKSYEGLGKVYLSSYVKYKTTKGSGVTPISAMGREIIMLGLMPELYTNPDEEPRRVIILAYDPKTKEIRSVNVTGINAVIRSFKVTDDNDFLYSFFRERTPISPGTVTLRGVFSPYAVDHVGVATYYYPAKLKLKREGYLATSRNADWTTSPRVDAILQ